MSEKGKPVKIGILKMGCIASLPLLEFILDERADRGDIEVRVFGVGAKLFPEPYGAELAEKALKEDCDLYIVISPNATLPGPTKAREAIKEKGKPVIVISDAPTKKIVGDLEAKGFGYIIVLADAMIGARREFLDPDEMSLYNSDIIKVLTISGAFRILYTEIDKVIDQLKKGETLELPKIVINKEKAVEAANFKNPYAKAKAMAAHEIACKVAELTVEGCFKVKERERYIPIVAAAHEMMRIAAKLADEAREIEKSNDTLVRMPHSPEGVVLYKEKLMEKPGPRG